MSQKRKTGSGKERAGAVRVAHAAEDTSPAAFPSTAALLTDCILPGLQGEPVVSPGRSRPDTYLLRGALAEVAAPLAIGPIESLSATATETILRERTNDFMAALRCKAEYLDEHSRRVGLLSALLAADLGLSREQSASSSGSELFTMSASWPFQARFSGSPASCRTRNTKRSRLILNIQRLWSRRSRACWIAVGRRRLFGTTTSGWTGEATPMGSWGKRSR